MINLRIQNPESPKRQALAPSIKVIGAGGGGGNAVNNMIEAGLEGVDFIVCNTDAQALSTSRAACKIQLGADITGGLGAGAKPEIGRAAAEESLDDLMQHIDGANMVFITAGMGGGTGTGVSPVIAKACKDRGILTVGVVTKPFHFEGTMRMKSAEAGIQEMQQYVDTLIVIPNQNLFRIATEKTTFADAFKLADGVLLSAVRGVTDLMVLPGLVNLDFADIRTTMTEMGKAMMGTGEATGDRRAKMAAEAAISNPLLDDLSMKGARGVIINIAGGRDLTLFEVDEACNRIREEVDPDASIIFGTSVDDTLDGSLRVTVLATGIDTLADRKTKDEGSKLRRLSESRAQAPAAAPVAARAAVSAVHSYGMSETPMVQQPVVAQGADAPFIPPQPVEGDMFAGGHTVPYSQIIAGVPAPSMPAEVPSEPVAVAAAPIQPSVMPEPQVAMMAAVAPVIPQVQVASEAVPAVPVANATVSEPAPADAPGMSLFQRITNRVRRTVEAATTDHPISAVSAPAPQVSYQQPVVTSQAVPAMAAQPRPNLAQPARAPQPELDLEIPAFLRRQAS